MDPRDDRAVVVVEGELDEQSGRTLGMVIDAVPHATVGLDLSHLTFLDVRGYYAIERALEHPRCLVTIVATNRWFDRLDDLIREGPL